MRLACWAVPEPGTLVGVPGLTRVQVPRSLSSVRHGIPRQGSRRHSPRLTIVLRWIPGSYCGLDEPGAGLEVGAVGGGVVVAGFLAVVAVVRLWCVAGAGAAGPSFTTVVLTAACCAAAAA